ncbi:MAG: M48 family metallopeptidase [Kiritimatiellae bacterium]|nr:M48 family metallopeptidase [Kiritimatiellia bacterium]
MTESVLRSGHNEIDGVPVEVVRKRIRRINLRVAADGAVTLSVPKWWATLRQGEAFLREKWRWVLKTRAAALARPASVRAPVTEAELDALRALLGELNDAWAASAGVEGVSWKIRKMKSLWGSCHWRDRRIVYNADLARAPRELVEYVVVHEYAHFAVHGHGPRFCAIMDERLPGWRDLRKRLNRREWDAEECAARRFVV